MKNLKQIILCILVVVCIQNSKAQLIKQWVDTNNNNVQLNASKIRLDSQGNVYTLATKFTSPNWTMLTQKRNSSGTLLWQKSYTQTYIYAKDMQVDASGNVYCFGEDNGTGEDAWLVKYSPAGVQQWVYALPSDFYTAPAVIRIDNGGNVVLSYECLDSIPCYNPTTQQNHYLTALGIKFLKINGAGNVVMNFHYQPANCANNGGFTILDGNAPFDIDGTGNIYMTYSTADSNSIETGWVMKINSGGTMAWNTLLDSGNVSNGYTFYINNIKYDPNNNRVLVAHSTTDQNYPPANLYLSSISNNGSLLWTNSMQGTNGSFRGAEIDGAGNAYVGYYPLANTSNFTIKKITLTGSSSWSLVANGFVNMGSNFPYYDESPAYTVDNAGNLYYVEWDATNYTPMHLNKISPSGTLVWQYTDAQPSYLINWFTNDINGNLYYYGREYLIKYNPCTLPTKSGVITTTGGGAIICPGETRTYTVPAAAGFTFNWTVPTGASITNGQGTRIINVSYGSSFNANGTIKVAKVNACGPSALRTTAVSVAKVANLTATSITAAGATLKWDTVACAIGYKLQYRKQGVTAWTTANVTTNTPSKTLAGLLAATTYQYRVATKYPNITFSGYSVIASFTTLVVRVGDPIASVTNDLVLYPNPATDKLNLEFPFSGNDATIQVINALGQLVLEQKANVDDEIISLNIENLKQGLYLINVINGDTKLSTRFIKK